MLSAILAYGGVMAQNHFAGVNTTQRVSSINAAVNPAELTNIGSKYEVQLFATSVKFANNKVGINDINSDIDFEELIFRGDEDVNMRFDAVLVGPGVAFRMDEWTFGLSTRAYAKFDLVDVDANIGDAISNNGLNIIGSTIIESGNNQRISGTSWGEVGISGARVFLDNEKHKFSGGVTFKVLFPGSYTNLGADSFTGTINNTLGDVTLTDTQANLNIAYSGNLGENFTDTSDYTSSLFGKPNGFAADFGINYQLKSTAGDKYRVNAGLSVRNLGGMTFSDNNNSSTDYQLTIQGGESLNMNVFSDVNSLQEVEQILLDSGFLDKTEKTSTDFKVKLPTVLSAYADVRVVSRFYVTLFTQQKLREDSGNDQITSQNFFSLTPRYTTNNFEIWSPWSTNEISGLAGGLGLRFYGFYLGSGSIITSLAANAKEADVFLGYSFGFR
ncbi:MAG: hypothetical protein ITG00_01270 [Flavobacterium sp.]|nr:hypothetical protein [Flavobacterium sp.]